MHIERIPPNNIRKVIFTRATETL